MWRKGVQDQQVQKVRGTKVGVMIRMLKSGRFAKSAQKAKRVVSMTKSSKGGKGDVGWAKLKNAIHFETEHHNNQHEEEVVRKPVKN